MSHPMVVLPGSSGYRPNKGVKREHDPDQIHDLSSKSPNANGTSDNHTHQHKKKKKSKDKSSQSPQQEDTLMSGGLGDMSAELGEPILSPPRDSQHSTPTMPKAMRVKQAKINKDGGSGKKKKKNKTKKNKTVHFEEASSNYRPPQVVDEDEEAENERFEMNGDSALRESSTLTVRSHSPILPPMSSPILPPTRPKRSSSHGPPPPILPQASPSRMNPLYVPPKTSTPILPPASPFRKRRGSTGDTFPQPPPTHSTQAPSPQATQSTSAKPTSAKSAVLKSKDDEWELSTGKIRAMIGDPMEEDAQREENVAFSSNYIQSPMRQAQGINVGGVNFNIWHIKNRETFIFKSKGTGLQVCSVAQGSIWVFLGLEKFRISKGGMWRIREGEICSAKNQDGHECVLHITAIPSASTLVNQ
ncbi:uncharacterized protein EAE97_006829 [Botrytis byssoidea]|uniref:Uncharacterized protein n=1 Tax=Botrytis byssoidea TaxID=139641 RepID=A0A9P5M1Z6_9HELO|nr:uncharacterized protein EAE97_006829 [Botrytis byssoidea]KAF7940643.1 hypothetical protein EAE97_006829 [Botrytis byssoidea]